ncbi:hypothetical protein EDD17DRAFT_1529877 [Pisolithus thermaeus]|nr:hypothetical protein EDD17DRAFT_1529877 [Pisolithus thermaeus]
MRHGYLVLPASLTSLQALLRLWFWLTICSLLFTILADDGAEPRLSTICEAMTLELITAYARYWQVPERWGSVSTIALPSSK